LYCEERYQEKIKGGKEPFFLLRILRAARSSAAANKGVKEIIYGIRGYYSSGKDLALVERQTVEGSRTGASNAFFARGRGRGPQKSLY